MNGYTGEYGGGALWAPQGNEVVFIAAHNIVAMDSTTGTQRFFLGHTAPVVSLAFSGDGSLLASAQAGKEALVRLWTFATGACITILCGHASGLVCVDVSQDGRALLAVGLDAHAKQQIMLWDISQVATGAHMATGGAPPTLVLRSTTEYNVRRARFSAYEKDKLMTCGRDSIRMYRLKGGTLRGLTVQVTPSFSRICVPENRCV